MRPRTQPAADPSWLVLADDLTGAADAAGAFRRNGYRSHLRLSPWTAAPAASGAVIAVDLDVREAMDADASILDRLEAALAPTCQEAAIMMVDKRQVYLKIDSTLRGPVRSLVSETRGILCDQQSRTGGRERRPVIVCPAFPAQRRVTRGGVQYADGLPVRGRGAGGVRAHAIAGLFTGCNASALGASADDLKPLAGCTLPDLLIGDAETDADLDAWVRAGETMTPLFWAGSAGLAAALARDRPGADPAPVLPAVERVSVVSGSANPRTHRQIDALRLAGFQRGGPCEIRIVQAPYPTEGPLDSRIASQIVEAALTWIEDSAEAGWILTGGTTAREFLCRAGVDTLEVGGEVEPGIPWLVSREGPLADRPIVTKAGGFGDPGALARIAAFLAGGARGL